MQPKVTFRNDAHRLIEEFMLEANRAVATFLKGQRIPLPYRIHEPPDPDDDDDLNEFLQAFGVFVRSEGQVEPRDVQRLLDQLQEHAWRASSHARCCVH